MAEIQQVVDDIRTFLRSEDQTRNDGLRGLAEAYAEACAEANQRLRQCDRLLQQGLRAEAIHAADANPNLLELVAALDFPERADWVETTLSYQLKSPPALFLESAESLNEAYALEDPLAELMKQHRRLALARAGLPQRIVVLNQIAALDPNNVNWEDDLRAYQKVRLREIADEADAAAARRDRDGLLKLVHELQEPTWREPPPQPLIQQVKSLAGRVRRAEARRALEILGNELNEAFAAFDVAAGLEARRRWREHVTAAHLAADDPILVNAEPALHWLDDQDERFAREEEYRRAVNELEQALDGLADRPELERLAAAARRHEKALPATLQTRLQARLDVLSLASKRRMRLALAGVLTAAAAAGAVGFYHVRQQSLRGQAARTVEEAERLGRDRQFDKAIAYVAQVTAAEPGLAASADLIALKARLEAGAEGERKRVAEFTSALEEAEQAEPSADDPEALTRATSLAASDEEKARVTRVVRDRQRAWRAVLAKRDEEILPRVASTEEQVKEVEDGIQRATAPEELTTLLDQARSAYDGLAGDAGGCSEALRARVGLFGKRLDEAARVVRRMVSRKEAEAGMALALAPESQDPVRNSAGYVKAVESFMAIFPDDPLTPALKSCLEERTTWDAALAWLDVSRRWRAARGRLGSPSVARELAGAVKAYQQDFKDGPDVESARRLGEAVEAAVAREQERASLDEFFKKPFMQFWMLKTTDGKRFYSQTPFDLDAGDTVRQKIAYVASHDLRSKLREWSVLGIEVASNGPSPQRKIAEDVAKLLSSGPADFAWEEGMVKILQRVREDPDIDRLLQANILARVAASAGKGSVLLKGPLTKVVDDLKKVDDLSPWMAPADPRVEAERKKAAAAVAQLPNFQKVLQEAREAGADLDRAVGLESRPVGWLVKEPGGWTCRLGSVPEAFQDADLWVVVPGRPAVWARIGSLAGGEVKTVGDDPKSLAAGRPVFAEVQEAEGQ